jgi:hypothetical protein
MVDPLQIDLGNINAIKSQKSTFENPTEFDFPQAETTIRPNPAHSDLSLARSDCQP